ncbi:cyclase [Actinomadura spongiicola]|uniref:Cyclase n=1 Tax=Actinomadura spongiicola TaxID=2303421 RepID=A0A372GJ58_9ACTN|nr:SRPBCC family protein [Actinomadura spongiicola]RFS85416.1 cyclase [Actinomadura spongiicola]
MADSTRSSITVKAGKAEIMAVIADLEAYPRWANGIRGCAVQESGEDGRASRAKVTFDGGPVSDTVGLAYTWEGDDRVKWELVEAGSVVTGLRGSYTLDDRGASTEVVYELAVDVKIPLPGLLKRQAEKRIVGSALKDLKRHVES